MKLLKQHENTVGCAGVKISGSLIGKYDDRVVYKSTCYGNTLLLSSRHLIAFMIQPVMESHCLKSLRGHVTALSRRHFRVI